MTRRISAAVCMVALVGLSCEDSFSPKGPFESKYFLYCIINFARGGASVQYAILNRSYEVAGTSPLANPTDSFVDSAMLQLHTPTRVLTFRQISLRLADSIRYGRRRQFYETGDVFVYPGELVSAVASVPGGPTLSGHTVVPVIKPMESQPTYAVGFTTNVNRSMQGNTYVLNWDDGSHDETLFFPSLTITYLLYDSAGSNLHTFPVPMKYISLNGQQTPVYPSPGTSPYCSFEFDAIDEAMRAISAGDSDKSRYFPVLLKFSVIEFDFSLSRYYMSVNGSMDQYSLRFDETVFSNVQGGGGIVGSTTANGIDYPFDPRYLSSFGYRRH